MLIEKKEDDINLFLSIDDLSKTEDNLDDDKNKYDSDLFNSFDN